MEPAKVLMLVETRCYDALMNKHYGNPLLEITTLTCIAANRLLSCSLCLPHSDKTFHFDAPPTAIVLPPLTSRPSPHSPTQSTSKKKLKLTIKEQDPARSTLKKFRNNLRFAEQNAGCFRHHPPALFLPPSILDQILDNLLSLVSSSNIYPLLDQWYHQQTHTDALFEAVVEIQTKIRGKREHARLEKNRKARETRLANKRKAVDSGQIRQAKRRKKVADSEDEQEPESDLDYDDEPEFDSHAPSDPDFPAALLPAVLSRSQSRVPKKQPLDTVTNISSRRTRAPVQKLADVVKDYGPQYRMRVCK
ncbi:hypothetical protein B0H14DRAFT_2590119 [Mycena olivaceomarginata]|nr:hypothetical protein B0H14DRAFT_2590119 [Mycena olivaceomarginata]